MSAQQISHPVDRAVMQAQITLPLLKQHYAVIKEFTGDTDQETIHKLAAEITRLRCSESPFSS